LVRVLMNRDGRTPEKYANDYRNSAMDFLITSNCTAFGSWGHEPRCISSLSVLRNATCPYI
jgi:hypothetical protein